MTAPVFVDDRLVTGWMTAMEQPAAGPIPPHLIERWRAELLAAVREAREPVPLSITGRYAVLERYLTGIAAGIAAGLGTSPASDAGDSDPVILAAGLLAGSAALQSAPDADRFEVSAGRAAAAAVVDAAANGAGLVVVIRAATRAASQVRPRALVSIALSALARSVEPPSDGPGSGDLYEVSLLLEPVDPGDELDNVALDHAIDGLCTDCLWIPRDTGYQLIITSDEPGALIETVWSFGRVRDLMIRHLPG